MDENSHENIAKAYAGMYDTLWYTAFCKLGDAESAKEVVNETFLRILQHAKWWDGLSNTARQRYILETHERLCLERRRDDLAFYSESYEEEYDNETVVELPVEHILDGIVVRTYIGKLSEDEQQIIEMKYFRDMSSCEIGEILKISEANVNQRMKRIRSRLQAFMEEDEAK